MSREFIAEIGEEVRENLARSVDALGLHEVDWVRFAVRAAGEVLVVVLLAAVFAGAHFVLSRLARLALRRWAPPALARTLERGMIALFGLAFVLALMAQWHVDSKTIETTARGGLVALGFYAAWAGAVRLMQRGFERHRIDPSLAQISKHVLFIVFAVLAFATARSEFGVDVVSLVAGLGIAGIAVGFAAQTTLSNFIAGVTILFEQPYKVGDWIRVATDEGKVTTIGLRATTVRTRDNVYVTIPNQLIVSSEVINYSAHGPLRLRLPVGITSQSAIERARAAVMPAIEDHPDLLRSGEMAPRLIVTGFGDSTVKLEVLVWIARADIDRAPLVTSDVLEKVKAALDAEGVAVPFSRVELLRDA